MTWLRLLRWGRLWRAAGGHAASPILRCNCLVARGMGGKRRRSMSRLTRMVLPYVFPQLHFESLERIPDTRRKWSNKKEKRLSHDALKRPSNA
jgi:hypothetical protein